MICDAMVEKPDVLVLPETWNTGFFPRENLTGLCDRDGERVKAKIGALEVQRNRLQTQLKKKQNVAACTT